MRPSFRTSAWPADPPAVAGFPYSRFDADDHYERGRGRIRAELGRNLVVLARECSLQDIARIQAASEKLATISIPGCRSRSLFTERCVWLIPVNV